MFSKGAVGYCNILVFLIAFIVLVYLATRENMMYIYNNEEDSSEHLDKLEEKIDKMTYSVSKLWCKTQEVAESGQFCLSPVQIFTGGNHMWNIRVCKGIEDIVGFGSIVDLGAGLGLYGMCFLRVKEPVFLQPAGSKHFKVYQETMGDYINASTVIASWDGYDGAINVERLSGGFVKELDLSAKDVWLGRRWDWVMSLEVGEHIPKEYEQSFMENLVRHGCKGIILSWAVIGQGGHKHVNCRSNEYVKSKMAELGLFCDEAAQKALREKAAPSYFSNTLMVFRYKERQECS